MKNDPCRKSLPPRVNKFFRKGPLRPEKSKKQKRGGNNFQQGSFFILWLFSSEALFCFLLFSGLRGPFWKNLFTPGGNNFWQGSFFILWLFCPRLLRPFFVFCFFSLPPRINKFFQKGPLKPKNNKKQKGPQKKKVIKWKMILVENRYHLE